MPRPDFQFPRAQSGPVTLWALAGIGSRQVSRARLEGKRLAKLSALMALLALTIAGLAQAEPDDNALPQSEPPTPILLQPTVQNGEIVGFEQVRRIFLNVGSQRLVFLVPLDFHVNVSDPKKVVLFKSDLTCTFTLRILAAAGSSGPTGVSVRHCRAWVTDRFDEAVITEELTLSAGGATGPAFDLICKQDRLTRNVRLGFVPTTVGVLECELSASPEQFAAAKTTMRILLRSLQMSGANGELTIPVLRGDN